MSYEICISKGIKGWKSFLAMLFLYLSTFRSYVKKAPFACVKAGRGDFF